MRNSTASANSMHATLSPPDTGLYGCLPFSRPCSWMQMCSPRKADLPANQLQTALNHGLASAQDVDFSSDQHALSHVLALEQGAGFSSDQNALSHVLVFE